jgi:hypothetical protein
MNRSKSNVKDPARFAGALSGFLASEMPDDESLTSDQIRIELQNRGLDLETSWAKAQAILKKSMGRRRILEAREARIEAAKNAKSGARVLETASILIAQIKALLSEHADAAVYARKWESRSVQDLRILRDQLVKTAARAAQRRKDDSK